LAFSKNDEVTFRDQKVTRSPFLGAAQFIICVVEFQLLKDSFKAEIKKAKHKKLLSL